MSICNITNKAEFKAKVGKKSLGLILACPICVHYLSIFMEQEMATENLSAILDIRTLNSLINNEKELKHKLDEIYNNYIRDDSPAEVNIDYKTKVLVEESRAKGLKEEIEALKIVEKALFENIETDIAPRFLQSRYFDAMYNYIKNKDLLNERKKLLTADDCCIVLNNISQWNRPERPPNVVIQELLTDLLKLIKVVLPRIPKPNGSKDEDFELANTELFGYIQRTMEYHFFEQKSTELQKINLTKLTCYKEKLSFFMNLYHVMMLHYAIMNTGINNCLFQGPILLRKYRYNIGGLQFSIDDALNGVLRGNKWHPILGRRFKDNDLRALFVINTKECIDPRIHFAISHLCESSPSIVLVTPDTVETILEQQTHHYLNTHVEFSGKQLLLPSIIQNSRNDFGNKTRDLLLFLEKFLLGEKRAKLLASPSTISFKKINSRTSLWSLGWEMAFEFINTDKTTDKTTDKILEKSNSYKNILEKEKSYLK